MDAAADGQPVRVEEEDVTVTNRISNKCELIQTFQSLLLKSLFYVWCFDLRCKVTEFLKLFFNQICLVIL